MINKKDQSFITSRNGSFFSEVKWCWVIAHKERKKSACLRPVSSVSTCSYSWKTAYEMERAWKKNQLSTADVSVDW
jgi:hypothetical protein